MHILRFFCNCSVACGCSFTFRGHGWVYWLALKLCQKSTTLQVLEINMFVP